MEMGRPTLNASSMISWTREFQNALKRRGERRGEGRRKGKEKEVKKKEKVSQTQRLVALFSLIGTAM